MSVVCIYAPQSDLELLAEAAYRYSSQISIRHDEAVFIEIEKSSRIYKPIIVQLRLQNLLQRLQINGVVAIAEDVPTSICLAKYGLGEKLKLPIECCHYFASPFIFDVVVAKKCDFIVWSLSRLGVKTLDGLLSIPQRDLTNRFQSTGEELVDKVRNSQNLVWPMFRPREEVREKIEFDLERPAGSLDEIAFHLKMIVDRVVLRLSGLGKKLLSYNFLIYQDKHSLLKDDVRSHEIKMGLSYGASKEILAILRERLIWDLQKTPLDSPIVAIELQVTETLPARQTQRDLFDPKSEENEEALQSLITRLCVRLGDSNVFFAKLKQSYLPEYNWIRSLGEIETVDEALPLPTRPLRVFNRPIPIALEGSEILINGKSKPITNIRDAETVSTFWWRNHYERNYVCVETSDGLRLWVYLNEHDQNYYLHGFFD